MPALQPRNLHVHDKGCEGPEVPELRRRPTLVAAPLGARGAVLQALQLQPEAAVRAPARNLLDAVVLRLLDVFEAEAEAQNSAAGRDLFPPLRPANQDRERSAVPRLSDAAAHGRRRTNLRSRRGRCLWDQLRRNSVRPAFSVSRLAMTAARTVFAVQSC